MADEPKTSGDARRFWQRQSAFEVLAAAIDCENESDINVEDSEIDSDFDEGDLTNTEGSESSDPDSSDDGMQQSHSRVAWPKVAEGSGSAEVSQVVQPSHDTDSSVAIDFQVRQTGPRQVPPRNSDPVHYLDEATVTHLVRETNRYDRLFLANKRVCDWIRIV